jgi:transposase
MKSHGEAFVGIDTAKAKNAVAVAEGGRGGEIRYLGEFDNTPDAVIKLLRADELTAVWVPDETHEAVRDLVRTRAMAVEDYRRKRQHVTSFLLRHGRTFDGKASWRGRHLRWPDGQNCAHPAQRFAYQELLNAVRITADRIDRLEVAPIEIMSKVVAAFQAMRGGCVLHGNNARR